MLKKKKIKQRFSSQTNEKKALRKTHSVQCYSDVIFMLFEMLLSPFPSEGHFSSAENQKHFLWNDSAEKGRAEWALKAGMHIAPQARHLVKCFPGSETLWDFWSELQSNLPWPGDSVVKIPPGNARGVPVTQTVKKPVQGEGLVPAGEESCRGKGRPSPVFLPGSPTDRGAW